MDRVRVAVVGCGAFGRNHLRVLHELPEAQLVAAVDADPARAAEAAASHRCEALTDWRALAGRVDGAVIAVPTMLHADVAEQLLSAGMDVLVEKPIAPDEAQAQRILDAAARYGRLVQVGHLERFNPAVAALRQALTVPLFFEIHRLSVFTPRSLDVDVILDLMIHDLDLVLTMTRADPVEIRAAGIRILSNSVDIANVRLAFASGCVANLTASRVSTERVRKLRLFQPGQYLSLDYQKQQVVRAAVTPAGAGEPEVEMELLPVQKGEPLKRELAAFLHHIQTRTEPEVSGAVALQALTLARRIAATIKEHDRQVRATLDGLPPPGGSGF